MKHTPSGVDIVATLTN